MLPTQVRAPPCEKNPDSGPSLKYMQPIRRLGCIIPGSWAINGVGVAQAHLTISLGSRELLEDSRSLIMKLVGKRSLPLTAPIRRQMIRLRILRNALWIQFLPLPTASPFTTVRILVRTGRTGRTTCLMRATNAIVPKMGVASIRYLAVQTRIARLATVQRTDARKILRCAAKTDLVSG